ncbi:hypothetical protein ACMD2_26205 [Ananas comosus]|uniref:Uncharacterized protein n=1 Tax=Ananas comosus TaxID=4615 RepID=A0A199UVE1_ANACO|nr:hypothetical protein ACMD2_26205 [Ananas comosus]
MPSTNYPPVVIEKDEHSASSSGSSGSDSSSSSSGTYCQPFTNRPPTCTGPSFSFCGKLCLNSESGSSSQSDSDEDDDVAQSPS